MKNLILGGAALAMTCSLSAQWTPVSPATSPAGRGGHGMAAGPGGTVLLFGGDTLGFPAGAQNDTWSYDGSNWSQLSPATSPPASAGVELVYDVIRGVYVTYGSLNTSFFGGASADRTWEFDGSNWTQVFPVNTPGGLGLYGMSYDLGRGRVVLYGGMPNNFFPIDAADTWEYDGTNWSLITTANSPGPLERPAMCYHDALGVTVLFGGIDVQIGGVDTTWLYDGTNWTQAPITGPRPAVRTGCKMAYDSARQICVMTGGQDPVNGTPFNDTWELDLAAMTWTLVPSTYTNGRLNAGIAFDATRRQVVMFGGLNYQTFSAYGDTWEYGARSEKFGTGCAGSNGVPALDNADAPRLGLPYTLNATNLNLALSTAVLVFGFTELPATSLDGIGMTGCFAYETPDALVTVNGTGGAASLLSTIPGTLSLMGVVIVSQALSLDPNVNPLWLAASNAHRGTLGN